MATKTKAAKEIEAKREQWRKQAKARRARAKAAEAPPPPPPIKVLSIREVYDLTVEELQRNLPFRLAIDIATLSDLARVLSRGGAS